MAKRNSKQESVKFVHVGVFTGAGDTIRKAVKVLDPICDRWIETLGPVVARTFWIAAAVGFMYMVIVGR